MTWKTFPAYVSLATLFAILALMVWAAHPWGDNYAYRDPGGYLRLAGLMAWAASPLLVLTCLLRRPGDEEKLLMGAAVLTVVICIASLYLVADAMILSPDAQSGLIFLVLPFYQWPAVAIVFLMRLTVSRR